MEVSIETEWPLPTVSEAEEEEEMTSLTSSE